MQTRMVIQRVPAASRRVLHSPGGRPPGAMLWFWRAFSALFFVVFLGGGLFSAYLFYETVRTVVASIPLSTNPSLPFIGPFMPASADPSDPAPVVSAPQQPQIGLEKMDRINFLLLGIDNRPGEHGPARTDTMIVVTFDPASKSVGMLSIPRDLWVPIPGFGEDRINQAYFIGDWKKYPGGGPALAKKTIQYNFGVPIHYYITINFVGFRNVIDALGGITVDVPKDINDPSYPDDTYGFRPLNITKGVHHFNGDEALAYARTRHADSDFGRMKRQQQVLKAVRDQALSLNIIPKIPALWAAREDMVQTDLTLDKILALAQLAKDVKPDNIQSAVVDESMALGITTPSGAMVLWPDRERIRAVIDQLFKPPETAPVLAPTQQPQQPSPQLTEQMKKLAAEGAKIELLNGTANEALTQRAATWLKAQGFNVALYASAERQDYAQTVVIESRDKPYTKGLLLKLFHVSQDVRQNPNPKSDVDIRLIIGADFNDKQIPESR